MKIVLVALIASLVGGGAVVGAVASGVVPLEALAGRDAGKAKAAPTAEADLAMLQEENEGLRSSVSKQSKDIADLRAQIGTAQSDLSSVNAKLDKKADKSAVEAKPAAAEPASTAGSSTASTTESPRPAEAPLPASTPEFKQAVRAELEAVEAERKEQRRLDRQAKRLEDLEKRKAQVTEFIPKLLANQATKLNMTEQQVKDAGTVLVGHAQKRLDIMSAIEEQRINDEDVDQTLTQQQLEDLNTATKVSLMQYVDEKTADQIMNTVNRMRGDGASETPRRGGGNK